MLGSFLQEQLLQPASTLERLLRRQLQHNLLDIWLPLLQQSHRSRDEKQP